MAFWAMPTESPVDGRTAWTVVDDDYVVQPEAAEFSFALRFASDRAEGTSRDNYRRLMALTNRADTSG